MLLDARSRPLATLRLSVTDRCNLRCQYCMPESRYRWLEKSQLLTFEEFARVVEILTELGLQRLRITGGEPLLRQDLHRLFALLRPHQKNLALTTNGVHLARQVVALKQAGLTRVTVSLDTLDRQTFSTMTRRDELDSVLEGIRSVADLDFEERKIDSVLLRGVNDHELESLVDFALSQRAEIRFIEYMDVGGATHWRSDQVVPQHEVLSRLQKRYGSVTPVGGRGSAPAERFVLGNGQIVGVIASVTRPFCADCDRLRLTADGQLLTCLYARQGLDLRPLLRQGQDVRAAIVKLWQSRRDQGAVERSQLSQRKGFVSLQELQADPRLEMHSRGG